VRHALLRYCRLYLADPVFDGRGLRITVNEKQITRIQATRLRDSLRERLWWTREGTEIRPVSVSLQPTSFL